MLRSMADELFVDDLLPSLSELIVLLPQLERLVPGLGRPASIDPGGRPLPAVVRHRRGAGRSHPPPSDGAPARRPPLGRHPDARPAPPSGPHRDRRPAARRSARSATPATRSPTRLASCLADLRRLDGVTRLRLGGFDQASVERFVAEATGQELDADLRPRRGGHDRPHRGKPLLRRRAVAPSRGHRHGDPVRCSLGRPVPASTPPACPTASRRSLRARVARLGPLARELIGAGRHRRPADRAAGAVPGRGVHRGRGRRSARRARRRRPPRRRRRCGADLPVPARAGARVGRGHGAADGPSSPAPPRRRSARGPCTRPTVVGCSRTWLAISPPRESLGGTDKAVYYGRRAGAAGDAVGGLRPGDLPPRHGDRAVEASERRADRAPARPRLGPAQRRALPREQGDVRGGVRGRSLAKSGRAGREGRHRFRTGRPHAGPAGRAGRRGGVGGHGDARRRTTSGPGLASRHRSPVRTPTPVDPTTHSRRSRPLWRRLARSTTRDSLGAALEAAMIATDDPRAAAGPDGASSKSSPRPAPIPGTSSTPRRTSCVPTSRSASSDEAAAVLDRHMVASARGRYPAFQFVGHAFEVVLHLAAGRFDEAERAAELAHALGSAGNTPFDAGVYGLQMFAIRREQGRLGEVAPVLKLVSSRTDRATDVASGPCRAVRRPRAAGRRPPRVRGAGQRRVRDHPARRGVAGVRDLPRRSVCRARRPGHAPSSCTTRSSPSEGATSWRA